jgi:catechol 2,3-dioxygenase-like lactoylglutathione lyase family enzyme
LKFLHVRLKAPARHVPALADFYGRELDIAVARERADQVSFAIGETKLEFVADVGEPFYHFALLVPGDRFNHALAWAGGRTKLLSDPESGGVRFDFDNWGAHACYFHDPAGNIVELIAHRGLEETGARGEFRPTEVVGLSELGLVGYPPVMAKELANGLGLDLWDGTVEEPGRLAFLGERARTLILSPPGRGWLPTRRPAEQHALEALLAHPPEGEVELEASLYRIRTTAAQKR